MAAKAIVAGRTVTGKRVRQSPGGDRHYRARGGIEPVDFIESNDLDWHEASAISYIFRWRHKGGVVDLQKAIWILQRKIQLEKKIARRRGQSRKAKGKVKR